MNIVPMKKAPIAVRSRMDTLILTPMVVSSWHHPPFQRPLKVNAKVRCLSEMLPTNGGVIDGVLTLGELNKKTYLLDGQHRVKAFEMSGLKEAYADVRICLFDTLADMGEEYVKLNSALVRMDPDDILRGLESSVEAIRLIKERCAFVGYGQVRRGGSTPVVSMSVVIRTWAGSRTSIPTRASGAALDMARETTLDEAVQLVQFLHLCKNAWGSDSEYYRLWGALNLTMCAWLYRRMVLERDSSKKATNLNSQQFQRCLMSLAEENYIDWLVGRKMSDTDRSPAYTRIRSIFASRIRSENITDKPRLPQPEWAS